jgi:hypothetical protein
MRRSGTRFSAAENAISAKKDVVGLRQPKILCSVRILTPLSFDVAPKQICEQYPAARTSHTFRLIFKLAATPRVGGLRDRAFHPPPFVQQQRPVAAIRLEMRFYEQAALFASARQLSK